VPDKESGLGRKLTSANNHERPDLRPAGQEVVLAVKYPRSAAEQRKHGAGTRASTVRCSA
jgi:hypothetical protein